MISLLLVRPVLNKIDEKETMRYAGMKSSDDFPTKIITDALQEALIYAQPIGIWQMYDYCEQVVYSKPDYKITSKNLSLHLKGAQKVAVLAVSVGEAIEERITQLFAENEYAKAVLLDAAATTATEQVADSVCELIAREARKQGLVAGSRFSPGYGDWDIKEQPEVLNLSGAEKIGIKLTTSFMLMPRKSVTAIVGLRANSNDLVSDKKGCLACNKQDCALRRSN